MKQLEIRNTGGSYSVNIDGVTYSAPDMETVKKLIKTMEDNQSVKNNQSGKT